MANIKTRALDRDEFELIIKTIRTGLQRADGTYIKPNIRIATALTIQGNLGLRIGDVLNLRLTDIVYESGRYHLEITEQKTKKKRTFTVPREVYTYLQGYALDQGISPRQPLFPITVRAVQHHLQIICKELKVCGVSTHSFRKFFAMQIYQNSDYNVELVRALLQHSSLSITQHYLSVDSKQIEQALANHIILI